jgi:hypothetical protein
VTASPGLELSLQAEALTGSGGARLRITLSLTNTGDEAVAPGIFASELLIDGRPDPSWRLALNGTVKPELVSLPPGQTAELTRELAVAALTPGVHEVAVRSGGQATPKVTVEAS